MSELKERRPDIGIRYRLLGEMWMANFMTIIQLTKSGVLLRDDVNQKLFSLSDLSTIMQFELDSPFAGYQPFFHYEVQPLLDYKASLLQA
ncbi:MAG TPA: hypothetical protein VEB86_20100 [Chryseosolibacter sp.]|nr:hypothetical protein [Chryseosolibacter sp.]